MAETSFDAVSSSLNSNITKKEYTITLETNSNTSLGCLCQLRIEDDASTYGAPIACFGKDNWAWPCLITTRIISNELYIQVDGKHSGSAQVFVIYAKSLVQI